MDSASRSAADGAPAVRDAAAGYEARALEHQRLAEASRRRSWWLGILRLADFVLLVAAAWWAGRAASGGRAALGSGLLIATIVAFIVLVVMHRREGERGDWQEDLRAVNLLGARRLARDWSALPPPPHVRVPATHPYAHDLDIVGPVSLARLTDVVSSAPGRPTLLGWLLGDPPPPEVIRERQAAVRELAPRTELREALQALARQAGPLDPARLERFVEWSEGEPWLSRQPLVLWGARILPALTLAAVVLQLAHRVSWNLWIIPAAAQLALLAWVRQRAAESIESAGARAVGFASHAPMMRRLLAERVDSGMLRRVHQRLAAGGDAPRQLARLARILAFAEVRYSSMMHSALQLAVLWDVHVLAALDGWRREAGAHLRDWLSALGEAESLAALAMLAYDDPSWSFPEITAAGPAEVAGEGLGHPLLPAASRVDNEVTVGPPGTLLLVTGSNMSGKSTLLRAIGVNVVLALAGGPVCARRMRLSVVRLGTSIRVQDSLERGVSLFMAELQRLKQVVDLARANSGAPVCLYLLDEMLHGTNTAERQIAARIVLGQLLRAGAIGAVTTHDLTLAAEPRLAAAAHPVHFTEQFTRGAEGMRMTFDYRLRPGLATSANALALLEMVGLGDGSAERSAGDSGG